MAIPECLSQYTYEPLKSFRMNSSRCASNYILLKSVQLHPLFFSLLYCTESYAYCLYTLSHILQLSIFISTHRTYTQWGEESLFTEQSRSIAWGSTGIQESSQSLLSIKWLPPNYHLSCIISLMTNVHDLMIEAGWQFWSGDRWIR